MIGNPIASLGSHLPTQIDVLRLYYNLPSTLLEKNKISAIVRQIEERYRENNLRIKCTETIRLKTKRLVKSCKDFVSKRMNCRQSNAEKARQDKFHKDIHGLFCVAENPGQTNSNRQMDENVTDSTQEQIQQQLADSDEFSFLHDDEPDHSPNNPDSDPDYYPDEDDADHSPKGKKPIPNCLLAQVSQTKGSYRLCQDLLRLGVQISGANPDDYQLSKSNIWGEITNLRSSQKNHLLSALSTSDYKIVVQFDGKSYQKLNERHIGIDERIIVLCHTQKGDIPLGLLVVDTHSGYDCAITVSNAIKKNNLKNRIVGMVCDTENVNTGWSNGACVEIERQLETSLLHIMCRHHVFEVILKDVFVTVFGRTSGPAVTTFDILNENWAYIKRSKFAHATMEYEEMITPIVNQFYEDAKNIIGIHANNHHFRNDYAELNDLVLKFLGINTNKPFRVPGATNNARWMCRAIYALKTYLFRQHLDLDPVFVNSLERFCMFVALIYTKFWNQSPNAADASFNDLQLMKELNVYRQIDDDIAESALVAIQRHLWYLSDELITLSLFSEKVSNDEKDLMVLLMIQTVAPRTENSIKYNGVIDDIQTLELHQFVSRRSYFLFDILEINTEFLSYDADTWNECDSYQKAKQMIRDLIVVVNDGAERALQLGAKIISNQKVRTEERLQNFIISA